MSFQFGQITVEAKAFHSTYEVQDICTLNSDKIVVSEPIITNKHDQRFVVGYESQPGKVIPLYVKTPKNCFSIGVSQFNETSPLNMGFTVPEVWVSRYQSIWKCIESLVGQNLTKEVVKDGKYINPKLVAFEGKIRTRFRKTDGGWSNEAIPFEKYVAASGVLKIGSVYKQGSNYYPQVFLKECKYNEMEPASFESQLSDSEDEGIDTVY